MFPLPAFCVCAACVCTRVPWRWQTHESEYFSHYINHCITLTTATHTYTHQGAQRCGDKNRGGRRSLTFTYNLFMLHTVIWYTWEKVDFSHSGKARLKQRYVTLK